MSTAIAAHEATEIQSIRWSMLRVAEWNARKTFDEAALVDLTASIQQHGIQVPLLVRPRKPHFEIVAGHVSATAGRLQ